MEEIFNEQILGYLKELDWTYILTFILFVYMFKSDSTLTLWWKGHPSSYLTRFRNLLLSIPKRIRVIGLGALYGAGYYYYMDCDARDSQVLLASFLFAISSHTLIISQVEKWVKPKREE